MSIGVRKIETSAERVAKLVMQRHSDGAQTVAAGPRAEQCVRPGVPVMRVRDDPGKRARQPGYGLRAERRGDRIAVFRIQGLYCMRDRIDARHNRKTGWQGHRQLDVVYDHLRENLRRTDRRLPSLRG